MSWKPRINALSQKPTPEHKLDKRGKIIESAASCFLRLGYAETSLDEIVSHSGVVKQTIYNYFENKDAVFRAAIEHLLKESIGEGYLEEWKELPAAEFFERVGKHQIKSLAEPSTRDFLRLIVKECRRFPELQSIYAESIPKPFVEFVIAYLEGRESAEYDAGMKQAIAWCFRSAITGFATLSNLAPLLPYPLPNRSRYLNAAATSFSRLIESEESKKLRQVDPEIPNTDSKKKQADSSLQESEQSSGKQSAGFQIKDKFASFLEAQRAALGEKKIAILSAAVHVLSERGFADTSMEEIANVAKVSKQTVYKHFRSKNFLYSFLAKCIIVELQNIQLPSKQLPLDKYLSGFLEAYMALCSRDWLREYFRVVFGESAAFPLESGSLLLFIMEHGRSQLESRIEEEFRGEDVDFSSMSILIRSAMGSFVLLSQIYVVAENPFLTSTTLLSLSETLLKNLRS